MKGFTEHRKAINCPSCKQITTYRNKGKASAFHHNEPHYKCVSCTHVVYATEMLSLVTPSQHMEEVVTPTVSQTQAIVVPQLDSSTQPDLQMLYQMIMSLTTELKEARSEIARLQEERALQQAPLSMPAFATPPRDNEEEFPTLIPAPRYPSAPWHQPQKVLALKQALSQNQEKREAAAARFFQAPSTTQGFQYLYIPTKARIPFGKLRTTFKKPGVNNGRLLDLHYPDRNIVAVLVHNDYAPDLQELLSKRGVKLQTTFDPCDERVLKDPKFANDTPEQRKQIARDLHNQRLQKALVHIRGPAKFAVARFFAHKTWITKEQLAEVLATDLNFTHPKDLATDDIFMMDDTASESAKSNSSTMEDPSSPVVNSPSPNLNQ